MSFGPWLSSVGSTAPWLDHHVVSSQISALAHSLAASSRSARGSRRSSDPHLDRPGGERPLEHRGQLGRRCSDGRGGGQRHRRCQTHLPSGNQQDHHPGHRQSDRGPDPITSGRLLDPGGPDTHAPTGSRFEPSDSAANQQRGWYEQHHLRGYDHDLPRSKSGRPDCGSSSGKRSNLPPAP